MSTAVKFTYDQYQEMIRLGLFQPREEHHVELIFGEIVPIRGDSPMSPIDPAHVNAVGELMDWSYEVLPPRAVIINAQCPIAIPAMASEPEPDLVWMVRKNYTNTKYPTEDVLLLIEVADSSLAKDRGKKSRLYAKAGIRDYWIVDLNNDRIEVRRDPVGDTFQDIKIYAIGESVHPLAFPAVALPVARIFPEATS